ncbi:MAG: N-acetylglucosamine-6-phosphate deacetylase [Alphaproteobacteria bacterium]|nr:N-acetylglucosamine-6-phosphate deacetylase [Alphaproteobacteria bacterium]
MAKPSLTALTGALVFTGEAFVEGHALLLQDGRVLDIVAEGRLPPEAETIAYDNCIVAPGFIDCQVNGGGNLLFNAATDVRTVAAIAGAHGRRGTSRMLLTCTSDSRAVTERALKLAREGRRLCPNVLGIHFEGPHLSAEHRRVHKEDRLRDMEPDDLQFYKPEPDEIMLVTVASERVTPEQIRQLRAQGVIVSLGHTAAAPDAARAALRAGATGFTHLFNGMGSLSARSPGPAGIALDDRDSWCGIIADGHHVSDEMIRLAHRAKPEGKLFLVSDAMPPAGADAPEPFRLYGETVSAKDGRCQTSEGRLAGSALTLAECVRYAIKHVGLEPAEALRMASSAPAAFLGIGNRFGKLLPGYAADLAVLNRDFSINAVWIDGVLQESVRK